MILLLLTNVYDLIGVGISSAGVINIDTGIVLDATNTIPNFIGFNIIETVYQGTGLKTTAENRQHSIIKILY